MALAITSIDFPVISMRPRVMATANITMLSGAMMATQDRYIKKRMHTMSTNAMARNKTSSP
jgi:hypothetical protein